jgi:hypothetical protein
MLAAAVGATLVLHTTPAQAVLAVAEVVRQPQEMLLQVQPLQAVVVEVVHILVLLRIIQMTGQTVVQELL